MAFCKNALCRWIFNLRSFLNWKFTVLFEKIFLFDLTSNVPGFFSNFVVFSHYDDLILHYHSYFIRVHFWVSVYLLSFFFLTAQLQTIRELGSSIRRSYRIIQDLQSLGISEYRIDKTPLHLAVKIGQDDIFRNVSKVSEDKNPADRFGRTPLHYAAKFGRVNLVEIMLKNGIKDLSPRTKMDLIAPIVGNSGLFQIDKNRTYCSVLW